ncbi:MAG: hypothetical protein U0133_10055 [Gemmatimonadales bacterium]
MRSHFLPRATFAALLALATTAMALPEPRPAPPPTDRLGMQVGAVSLTSAGAMTFNQDGILFLADSRAATLVAIDPAETGRAEFGERDLVPDLDQKVAGLLGTTRDRIRFGDMARNPKTGSLYFTVTRVAEGGDQAALVRAAGRDRVELVNLDNIRHSSAPLPAAPSRDAKTSWGQPQWTLAVTDLAYVDGELWVAGLSNEQFASALRRVPFPFGKASTITSVEIFHTSHNRWETASPITSFLPLSLNGTPSLLAGYGCSPIATFTRADLKKGGHLRGRTVAELGGGNQPVDMVQYQNKGKSWILIANSDRTLMRFDPSEIAGAPAMTKGVDEAYQAGGVGFLAISGAGIMRLAEMPEGIAILRRDIESGAVEVGYYRKEWL